MQFKEWYYLQEKIDANTKANLTIQINNRFKDDEEKKSIALDLLQAIDKEEEDYKSNIGVISKKIFADPRLKKEKSVDGLLSKVDRFNTIEFNGTPEDKENIKQTLKYFFNQGTSNQQLEEMMNLLKTFIPEKKIKLEFDVKPILFVRNADRGWEQISETGFTQFSAHLHAIDSMLQKQKSASHYFNPSTEFDQDEHLVAKGDNIWVFKGGRPDICRRLGKGQKWCISSTSSASHWFNYRMGAGQTQYFIFDFNWPEGHPARYVNPGVAPEGKYSEWVDFENYPNRIEGFESIDDYKKYLSDKGVDLSVFKADPIQDWEKRLQSYVNKKDVDGARNDKEIFDLFLKIVEWLEDKDFDSLNDKQKKTYLLGRIYITENQSKFAFEKFRKDYLDSLNFNDDGITELLKIAPSEYNQEIAKLIIQKKTELTGNNVYHLLYYATDKQEIADILGSENINKLSDFHVYDLLLNATDKQEMVKLIIQYKTKLTDSNVAYLLLNATDKQEIAKLIIQYKTELTEMNVYELLFYATNTQEIANILGSENINKLSDKAFFNLLRYATDKQEIAKLIIQKKTELTDQYVNLLLLNATDKQEIAKLIIQKKTELTGDNVYHLLYYATDKQEIAKLIIQKKTELTGNNVYHLLYSATDKQEIADILGSENINKLTDDDVHRLLSDAKDKQEMAKLIIQYKTELTGNNVYHLLYYATDKQEIANILGSENINKLSDDDVGKLLHDVTNKQEMAKLIIQYKTELTDDNVSNLLLNATDKQEIANILGSEKNINKLSDESVSFLLYISTDPQEMAKLIIQNKTELTGSNVSDLLLHATDKQEIANILGSENINKLSDYKVYELLRLSTDKQEIAEAILKKLTSASKLSPNTIEELEKIAKGKT